MSESSATDPVSGLLEGLRRRVRGVLFLGGVGVVLYVLWDIAQLFLVAALVAYLLNPLVRRFQGAMGRTPATLLVLGLLVVGGVGLGVGIKPVIEQQIESLRANIQPEQVWTMVQYLEAQLSAFTTWLGGKPVELGLRGKLSQTFGNQLFRTVQGVLGIARNAIVIPFLAVFLLRDGPQIKRNLIRLVPNRYFEFSLEALHKIDVRVGNYLRGLVIQNTIISVLAIGVLWVLQVPSFLLLGVLVGLTNFIPYVGPFLGGSVVVLVQLASTGSGQMAGLVLLGLLAIQLVDEALIAPVVYGKAVDLHPLEVLFILWVAVQYFGPVGIVLAIPLASAAKVVFTEATALIQQYRFSSRPG